MKQYCKKIISGACLCLLCCGLNAPVQCEQLPLSLPNEAPEGEMSELWTGSLYSSSYRVGLCISALGNVRGALFLTRADGKTDEYHFTGTVKDNHIEAKHSSGHSFSGRLSARDKVEGRITLKNGMKIFLEGQREQNASLNFNDCSPLVEH